MEAKVMLLQNVDEIAAYEQAIAEHGMEEAFNLGKVDGEVTPVYVSNDFMFKLDDVRYAWVIHDPDKLINIRDETGETWSLKYTDELWNKLKEHLG